MQNDWILDVLADLKTFASTNDLAALADQLDDTMLIAAAEIASQESRACVSGHGSENKIRPNLGGSGRRQLA